MYQLNQTVYYIDRYTDTIIRCRITAIKPYAVPDQQILTLKDMMMMSDSNTESYRIPGTQQTLTSHVYPSFEAALLSKKQNTKNLEETYRNEIQTLQDLLQFPLRHCIAPAEEYTNQIARDIYIERCEELTGIKPNIL